MLELPVLLLTRLPSHTPTPPRLTLVLPTASSSELVKPVTCLLLTSGSPSEPLAFTRPAGPWHTAAMILPARVEGGLRRARGAGAKGGYC